MQKCLQWVLCIALVLTLSSCGESVNKPSPPPTSSCEIASGSASLTGSINYQDRLYTQNSGFMGIEPYKPVRYAALELLNEQGSVIATTATDNSGNFDFGTVSSGCHSLRILAQTAASSDFDIAVNDQSGALYAVTTDASTQPSPQLNVYDIQIDLASGLAGVFNILDVLTSGNEYLNHLQGMIQALPTLNAYWEQGNPTGTYMCSAYDTNGCSNGAGIYILNSNIDSDEHDDDVLWHEYFHFIEDSLLVGNSPGGVHYFENNQLDPRLSWSEGYANYYQASLKTWLRENHPERLSIPSYLNTSFYVDNLETTAAISADLAIMNSSPYIYSTNEGAVANVMWEVEQSHTRQVSWDVLMNHMTSNTTRDTLEAYWDGINLLGSLTIAQRQAIQTLLAGREIFYQWDAQEQDDDSATATLVDCQTNGITSFPYTCLNQQGHYLYTAVEQLDRDYYQVTLSANHAYRFYTDNLRNAADTQLTLYDQLGTIITGNDDAIDCSLQTGGCLNPMHNGSNFSSEINYTPTSDQTVYIAVQTSSAVYYDPDSYGYIGRYGSYDLSIVVDLVP